MRVLALFFYLQHTQYFNYLRMDDVKDIDVNMEFVDKIFKKKRAQDNKDTKKDVLQTGNVGNTQQGTKDTKTNVLPIWNVGNTQQGGNTQQDTKGDVLQIGNVGYRESYLPSGVPSDFAVGLTIGSGDEYLFKL
jgi:hypothetical protein